MAARRRAGSFSPNTSWRLRVSKVDMLYDMACLLSASSAACDISTRNGSSTGRHVDVRHLACVPSTREGVLVQIVPGYLSMRSRPVTLRTRGGTPHDGSKQGTLQA